MDRNEIETEVRNMIGRNPKRGLFEHVMAFMLRENGHNVDVHCPDCKALLVVDPFPGNNGYNVSCECGTCSGAFVGQPLPQILRSQNQCSSRLTFIAMDMQNANFHRFGCDHIGSENRNEPQ